MKNCTVIDLGYKSDNKAFKITIEIYATEFVQESYNSKSLKFARAFVIRHIMFNKS